MTRVCEEGSYPAGLRMLAMRPMEVLLPLRPRSKGAGAVGGLGRGDPARSSCLAGEAPLMVLWERERERETHWWGESIGEGEKPGRLGWRVRSLLHLSTPDFMEKLSLLSLPSP